MDNQKHAGGKGSAGTNHAKGSGSGYNDTHQVQKHGHEDVRGQVGEHAKISGKG